MSKKLVEELAQDGIVVVFDVDDSQLLDVLKKNVFKKDFKKIEKLEDLLRHGDGKIIVNR